MKKLFVLFGSIALATAAMAAGASARNQVKKAKADEFQTYVPLRDGWIENTDGSAETVLNNAIRARNDRFWNGNSDPNEWDSQERSFNGTDEFIDTIHRANGGEGWRGAYRTPELILHDNNHRYISFLFGGGEGDIFINIFQVTGEAGSGDRISGIKTSFDGSGSFDDKDAKLNAPISCNMVFKYFELPTEIQPGDHFLIYVRDGKTSDYGGFTFGNVHINQTLEDCARSFSAHKAQMKLNEYMSDWTRNANEYVLNYYATDSYYAAVRTAEAALEDADDDFEINNRLTKWAYDQQNSTYENGDLAAINYDGIYSTLDHKGGGYFYDNDGYMPLNKTGNQYLTGEPSDIGDGIRNCGVPESAKYRIVSPEFTLTGAGLISAKLGGHFAELQLLDTSYNVIATTGAENPSFVDADMSNIAVSGGRQCTMTRTYLDCGEFVNQRVHVALLDNRTGGNWNLAFFDEVVTNYPSLPNFTVEVIEQVSSKDAHDPYCGYVLDRYVDNGHNEDFKDAYDFLVDYYAGLRSPANQFVYSKASEATKNSLIDTFEQLSAASTEVIELSDDIIYHSTFIDEWYLNTVDVTQQIGVAFIELVDIHDAAIVEELIDNINDTVTLADEADILFARDAYEMISDEAKDLVPNYQKLLDAEDRLQELQDAKAAADEAIDYINSIGTVTLDSEDDIDIARSAYDNLDSDGKSFVPNETLAVLLAAEARFQALQDAKSDAEAVEDDIEAIGVVTLDKEDAIVAARASYNSLSDDAKDFVSNLDTLVEAEERLTELKTEKANASAVDALISAIGEVTLEKEEAINTAREAFDALNDEEQDFVENLATLETAETTLAVLKAAAALQQAKLEAKEELENYKDSADYREAEQNQLANIVATGKDNIDAALDTDGVTSALNAAKAQADALKTKAAYEAEEAAAALTQTKTNAKTELANYKNSADYREAEQTLLAQYIDEGNTAIDAAQDQDGIDSALAAAKAKIDGLTTKAQYEEQEAAAALAKTKSDAKAELAAYKNSADYRQAEQALLAQYITEGNTAIDEATDAAGITSALNAAKANIDALKTDAELTQQEAAELAAYKTEKKEYLDNKLASIINNYREAEQTAITNGVNTAKGMIDDAQSKAEVDQIIQGAEAALLKYKTAAQYEAEEAEALANAKTAAKNQLDAWVTAHLSEYRQAEQTSIQNAVADAKTAIDNAQTTAAIQSIVDDCNDFIAQLDTDAQLTAQEHVDVFVALVDAIGTVEYTQASADKINAALAAYQALTAEEKEMLPAAKVDVLYNAINEFSTLGLNAYKQSAKDFIDEYVTEAFLAHYRQEQQEQINTFVADTKTAIDNAQTTDEVDQILSSLGQSLSQVRTAEELTAQELVDYKREAVDTINNYYDNLLNTAKYTDANAALLLQAKNDAITAVNAASDKAGVDATLLSGKASLDAVEKVQATPEPEAEPQPVKKGCGSSVLAASMLISTLALAGFGLLLSKKRKQD